MKTPHSPWFKPWAMWGNNLENIKKDRLSGLFRFIKDEYYFFGSISLKN